MILQERKLYADQVQVTEVGRLRQPIEVAAGTFYIDNKAYFKKFL